MRSKIPQGSGGVLRMKENLSFFLHESNNPVSYRLLYKTVKNVSKYFWSIYTNSYKIYKNLYTLGYFIYVTEFFRVAYAEDRAKKKFKNSNLRELLCLSGENKDSPIIKQMGTTHISQSIHAYFVTIKFNDNTKLSKLPLPLYRRFSNIIISHGSIYDNYEHENKCHCKLYAHTVC